MGARQRRDGGNDVADIGELRKGFGGQERADLEMPHAGAVFLADPALLGRCRGKRLHQLQAVAQAHLAQADAIVGINVLNTGHASLAAVLAVGESFWFSSSARIAGVSAPSTGTLRP